MVYVQPLSLYTPVPRRGQLARPSRAGLPACARLAASQLSTAPWPRHAMHHLLAVINLCLPLPSATRFSFPHYLSLSLLSTPASVAAIDLLAHLKLNKLLGAIAVAHPTKWSTMFSLNLWQVYLIMTASSGLYLAVF